MTNIDFITLITNQFQTCGNILEEKAKEYVGDDKDRLGFFKALAKNLKVTPEAACWYMLSKHLQSLQLYCDSIASLPKNAFNDKITDSINYLLLLKALHDEKNLGGI